MKYLLALCSIIYSVSLVAAQSGRKNSKPAPAPTPTPVEEPKAKSAKPEAKARSQVAVIPNEEYKCLDDGGLGVVVPSSEGERVFAPNEVTTKAVIRFKPKPEYSPEARRRAVEGTIAVRLVLSSTGKVFSVKITNRGLPFGLNESAIHAACKTEFTPATKDGQHVSQWAKEELTFRLQSSILRP